MSIFAFAQGHNSPRRFWYLLALPILVFVPLAYYTEDTALILVLNIVLASVASAITVTFTPEAMRILIGKGHMNRGDLFAYGIWLSWGAVVYRVIETLAWRYLGQPMWLVNSDITSGNLFISCVAGIFHIARPGELNDRLPIRQNIRIGIIVGLSVAAGLAVVERDDICVAWTHQKVSWMHTPGLESAVAGPPPDDFRAAEDVPKPLERALLGRGPAAASPTTRRVVIDPDLMGNDDTPTGEMPRLQARVTPQLKARVEASRVANGEKSLTAAIRRLLERALGDEDRDALGEYGDGKR